MDDFKKSRTQKKNEDRELKKLGESLMNLSADQLEKMNLPRELAEAVRFAKHVTSHGARRRQLQYIGTCMRTVDPDPIRQALAAIHHKDAGRVNAFKKIENWRDELKQGNWAPMDEILESYPGAERQQLSQLVRNAQKEHQNQKGIKASRVLFRYIKEVADL